MLFYPGHNDLIYMYKIPIVIYMMVPDMMVPSTSVL